MPRRHIPGAVHSDYDKAGWRVTRNGVPFMLPTLAELEKLIGEIGIDEDSHVVVVPAGVQRDRLRLGGAGLLDAQGGRPSGGVDPRRRLRRLAGGGLSGRERQESAVAEDFHGEARRSLLAAGRSGGEQRSAPRSSMRGPASFFDGKEKAPAAKAYGHIPGALNLDSATLLRSGDQPAAAEGAACSDRRARCRPARSSPIATPATGRRPTGSCCRSCSAGPTCGSTTARWSNGPPTPRRPVASRAHALGRSQEGARLRLVSSAERLDRQAAMSDRCNRNPPSRRARRVSTGRS